MHEDHAVDIAYSVNGVPIRLTEERWNHIVRSHDDLAGYDEDRLRIIESPDLVLAGTCGSLKAVKGYGRIATLWSFIARLQAMTALSSLHTSHSGLIRGNAYGHVED
jgi:hypothetical protein